MTVTNVLLVLWSRGWAEVTAPDSITAWGRREGTLGLGSTQSLAEVVRISAEQLALYGRPLTEIAVDLAPAGDADRPYRSYLVGDVVNNVPGPDGPAPERLVELTVSETGDGEVTYAPTFRDLVLEAQEKFQEQLKKMANGTLGGSPAATPLAGVGVKAASDCCPPRAVGGDS